MAAVRDLTLQRVRLDINLGGATSLIVRKVSSLSEDSISHQIKEALRTLNLQPENVQFYDPAGMESEEITDVITLSGLAGLLADVMLRQLAAEDAGLCPAWNDENNVMTIKLRAKVIGHQTGGSSRSRSHTPHSGVLRRSVASTPRAPSAGAGGGGSEEQGEEEYGEAALGTEANMDKEKEKQKKGVLGLFRDKYKLGLMALPCKRTERAPKGQGAGAEKRSVILTLGKTDFADLEKEINDPSCMPAKMLNYIGGRAMLQTLQDPALKRADVTIGGAARILADADLNKVAGTLLSDSYLIKDLEREDVPGPNCPPTNFSSMFFEKKRNKIEPISLDRIKANNGRLYKSKWDEFVLTNSQKLTREQLESDFAHHVQFCTGANGCFKKGDVDAAAEEARKARETRKRKERAGEQRAGDDDDNVDEQEAAGSQGGSSGEAEGAEGRGISDDEATLQQRILEQAAAAAAAAAAADPAVARRQQGASGMQRRRGAGRGAQGSGSGNTRHT